MTMAGARPDRTDDDAWRRFVVRFVAVFVANLAVVLCFVLLIDPYDSGRFPSIGISGTADRSQRTENVGLGRSEKFNAAIFGNSHGLLLDPERLTRASGLSFVQLTVPGASAPEQLAMLHWFIRHHARIGALVLVTDYHWCDEDPRPWNWFPFWLYGDSNFQYVVNSLNSRSAGAAVRRVKYALGFLKPSDPRGYEDYEIGVPTGYKFDFATPPAPKPELSTIGSPPRPFPAVDRLAVELAAAPPGTPIVILFPPEYYSSLPTDPQTVAVLRECKLRMARLAVGTTRGGFLDYLVDSPLTRDQANFQDLDHYRAPVARRIEAEIAGILKGQAAQTR